MVSGTLVSQAAHEVAFKLHLEKVINGQMLDEQVLVGTKMRPSDFFQR